MKSPRRKAKRTGKILRRKPRLRAANSRFEAVQVDSLIALTGKHRFEIQLSDARGNTHVVSLPLLAAVELGCLICDASEAAPYLVGGIQRSRK